MTIEIKDSLLQNEMFEGKVLHVQKFKANLNSAPGAFVETRHLAISVVALLISTFFSCWRWTKSLPFTTHSTTNRHGPRNRKSTHKTITKE
jgi:hypothetical protein